MKQAKPPKKRRGSAKRGSAKRDSAATTTTKSAAAAAWRDEYDATYAARLARLEEDRRLERQIKVVQLLEYLRNRRGL